MKAASVISDLAGIVSTTFLGLGEQRSDRRLAAAQLASAQANQRFANVQFQAQRQDMQLFVLAAAGLGGVYLLTRRRR